MPLPLQSGKVLLSRIYKIRPGRYDARSSFTPMHVFRLVFVFPVLLALLPCAVPAHAQQPSPAPDELSEQYFHAYMMGNEAERLAQAGNNQQAMDLYQKARTIFDTIATNSPHWETPMMNMRRGRINDAISALQAKMAATPAPAPAAPATPAIATAAPGATSLNGQFQAPPPASAPATAPPVQAAPTVEEALNVVRRAMEAQMATKDQQATEAFAQVGRYQLAYETTLKQRDEIAATAQTLSQTATTQQTRIAELEKQVAGGGTAKADLDKLKAQHEDTLAQLKESKERLTKSENAVMKQTKDLMETSMKLTALQKEHADLAKKLETISTDRDALMKERDRLAKENETLAKDRDTANAQLLGMKASGPVPPELKDLVAENQRLTKELDAAREQVKSLKADATHKDQEIAQLKGQLNQIQGELVALKKENAAYESQVSELTLNLKKLRAEMDDPKKAKPGEAAELLAESQLLRGIILRQLRQQARQQQTKATVIAEIQKTENASKDLIDQVEQLGGSRFTLSEDEQKLFTTPQLQEFTGEGIQATIMARSGTKKPGDDAKKGAEQAASAADGLLEKANVFLRDGKFAEAASAYSDVLRADPKNPSGFAGLAMARMQQGKLDEAETTLKKSLAYDANNANAHYMLGVTMFRRDRLNEAMSSFQKSLELDGKNPRARHYLGVIASKMGLAERAEREFKATLAMDPDYGEAYFNLAVLYVTWDPPKWDDARKNYKEAIKKGVKPDANLEKIINDIKPGANLEKDLKSGGTSVSKR